MKTKKQHVVERILDTRSLCVSMMDGMVEDIVQFMDDENSTDLLKFIKEVERDILHDSTVAASKQQIKLIFDLIRACV